MTYILFFVTKSGPPFSLSSKKNLHSITELSTCTPVYIFIFCRLEHFSRIWIMNSIFRNDLHQVSSYFLIFAKVMIQICTKTDDRRIRPTQGSKVPSRVVWSESQPSAANIFFLIIARRTAHKFIHYRHATKLNSIVLVSNSCTEVSN